MKRRNVVTKVFPRFNFHELKTDVTRNVYGSNMDMRLGMLGVSRGRVL
jgi:hypothetical protein